MTIIKREPIKEFIDISDYLLNDIPLKNTYAEVTYEGERPPRIIEKDGKIVEITVSSSLIRSLLYCLDPLPMCPYRTYHVDLLRDTISPPTLSMLYGQYFETLWLGSGAGGSMTLDLPRHKKTGEKLSNQKRIEEAVLRAEYVGMELGLILDSNNIQCKAKKVYEAPGFEDIIINLSGEADIISPIEHPDFSHDVAVIDAKLTLDRTSCWKPFCWGCPEEMDLTQAVMYSLLFELPFVYLVFDYKKMDAGWKAIPVAANPKYCTEENKEKATLRVKELEQAIRWVVGSIQMWEAEGWKKEPSDICDKCPIKECELKHKVKEI